MIERDLSSFKWSLRIMSQYLDDKQMKSASAVTNESAAGVA